MAITATAIYPLSNIAMQTQKPGMELGWQPDGSSQASNYTDRTDEQPMILGNQDRGQDFYASE